MMKQYKLSSTARAAMTLAQAARRVTAALAIILLTAMTAGAQTPSGNWNDWVNDNNIDWDSADAKAAAIPQSDDGSTVYISTAEQLAYYAYAVNNDKQISGSASGYYCGRTVELMADIDLSAHYWKPIGWNTIGRNRAHYFSGYFHGNGHVITGIHVNGDPKSDIVQQNLPGYGLFGYLHERSSGTSTITDLVLKDFSITASYSDGNADEFYLGGLVGKCDDNTAITNCLLVNGSVSKAFQNYWAYIGKVAGRGSPSTATANYYHNVSVSGWISGGGGGNYALQTIGGETEARAVALTISGTHGNVALGGTVGRISDGIIYAPANETVTLNTTADAGYIASLAATGLTLTSGQFTMPDNDDGTITATVSIDPAQFSVNDAGTEYTIHTAGGWNVFCDLLAENANGYFSGKTVRLGADITVTRMAGGSNHAFTGTFDGQGHTLTVNYGTADEPVNAQFVAPFVEVTGGAKFTNLNIGGHIYAAYTGTDEPGVGGLIGHLFGGITIEDCTSTVTVNSTKDRVGGFVGLCEHAVKFTNCKSSASVTCTGSGSGFVGWSRASKDPYTIAFEGCLFDGKVLKKNDVGSGNGGFVGWTGSTKTVSIQNSLVALDGVGSMASGNSTTFARGWDGTFDNSFYTQPFGTAQGKATRTVTAGDNVTIDAIALTGDATQYTVSGITAYSGGGLQRGQTLYYGSDDQLSLTLSSTAAPLGYQYGYTASAGTLSGTTLTMPDENVTISVNTAGALRSTGQPVTVAYIKADGTPGEASAIALDGHEAVGEDDFVHLAGTYYVGTDITYANQIWPDGNITLILADGKTMTLNGNTIGIGEGSNLTIYGQSLDAATAGTLRYNGKSHGIYVYNYVQHSGNVSITTAGSWVRGIIADVTLWGGTLTISANGNNAYAILGTRHSILGGQLTATATGTTATGILATAYSGIALTLGWIRPADRITASSISTSSISTSGGGTVAVAIGKALINAEGDIYESGTVNASDINGKTLRPYSNSMLFLADDADNTAIISKFNGQQYNVTLAGRTLYKDGSWNTLCLPFDISTASGTLSGDNVQAMTLNTATSSLADGTLTLNFTDATGQTIPAGTPFIIKWDNTGVNIENPVFEGVTVSNATNDATVEGVLTFTGTYAPVSIGSEGDNTKLYLGAANKLYYPNAAMTIGTHRAYFQLLGDLTAGEPVSSSNARQIRAFNLNFGDDEATGIVSAEANSSFFTLHSSLSEWYTLDGRRLDGKPTAKGIYINNGRKVVIK
ncbi:MAG: hypothetical protein IJR02_12150 [Bacteroidaceae bacterium]|nr:hypothetical protein [Bacteroidaceae bacterium]